MSKQPTALELAEIIERDTNAIYRRQAAAELRRLHDDIEMLAGALREREDELRRLHTLLMEARPHVEAASTRYYDGTGGHTERASAKSLLVKIDALDEGERG